MRLEFRGTGKAPTETHTLPPSSLKNGQLVKRTVATILITVNRVHDMDNTNCTAPPICAGNKLHLGLGSLTHASVQYISNVSQPLRMEDGVFILPEYG